MCALKTDMQQDEKILFESDRVILTNLRLLAGLDKKTPDIITDEVVIKDIATFKMSNGGQETRLRPGLVALALGLALTFLQVIIPKLIPGILPGFVEAIVFLAGSISLLGGFYLIMTSLLRIKPHTVVMFSVVGARDVPVYFAGQNSSDAEELTRRFGDARRAARRV